LQAINLISVARDGNTQDALMALMARAEQSSIKSAAVSALDRRDIKDFPTYLIDQWPHLTPQVRSAALTALLKKPDRCLFLIRAIEDRKISLSDLSSSQLNFLLEHPERNVAGLARQMLSRTAKRPRQQIIDAFMPALDANGDGANGKKLFLERCSSCHRLGNDGFALGPDLVTVKNSGKDKLLTNILDPNREVASQYSAYLVETKDSDSLLGIIVNDTATSITLRQAYGVETVVFRNNIKKLKNQGQSLMPEGLEEGLKAQDLADLLEFISTVK
jgi:putative heme-binding domain-containing protein